MKKINDDFWINENEINYIRRGQNYTRFMFKNDSVMEIPNQDFDDHVLDAESKA